LDVFGILSPIRRKEISGANPDSNSDSHILYPFPIFNTILQDPRNLSLPDPCSACPGVCRDRNPSGNGFAPIPAFLKPAIMIFGRPVINNIHPNPG